MTSRIRSRKLRKPAKKRMLLIVTPYATTASHRLKTLVVYALQGRFEVETVATEAQNHATEIGREVRDHGYDVVVAFGGGGTLNEVADGLARRAPLVLPLRRRARRDRRQARRRPPEAEVESRPLLLHLGRALELLPRVP